MFCYLFMMSDGTSIPLHTQEHCFPECEFIKDNKCDLLVDRAPIKLTSDRFGWLLEKTLLFKKPFSSKSGNTIYLAALLLIHPSNSDVWIVKCKRLDKSKDEWSTVYRFHNGGDCTEFDELVFLNRAMRKLKYDGRFITEDDFTEGGVE